jgi:hypothetical protein
LRTSRSLPAVPLVFVSPTRAFESIRDRGGWIGAFLVGLALMAAAFAVQLPQSLRYQAEVTQATMEKFDLPQAEIDEAMRRIPDPARLTASEAIQQVMMPVLFVAPVFFLAAVVFHLLARAFGAQPRFAQSLGIFAIAELANSVGALVKGVLVRATDSVEVSLGPGSLVPGIEFDSPLGIFLDLFDVFSLLGAALVAIGTRVVLGVSPRTAWVIAASFWTLRAVVVFLLRLSQTWFTGS